MQIPFSNGIVAHVSYSNRSFLADFSQLNTHILGVRMIHTIFSFKFLEQILL